MLVGQSAAIALIIAVAGWLLVRKSASRQRASRVRARHPAAARRRGRVPCRCRRCLPASSPACSGTPPAGPRATGLNATCGTCSTRSWCCSSSLPARTWGRGRGWPCWFRSTCSSGSRGKWRAAGLPARIATDDRPIRVGLYLVSPGMIAVALALNVLQAGGTDRAGLLLATVVDRIARVGADFAPGPSRVRQTRDARAGGCARRRRGRVGAAHRRRSTTIRAASRWRWGSRWSWRSVTGDILRRFQLPRLTGLSAVRAARRPVPRQPHHRADGPAAPGDQRHRDDADCAHRRADAEPRAARPARWPSIARLTLTTLAVAMVGLFVVVWLAWPWLPVAAGRHRPRTSWRWSLLLVIIVVSFSPTMTAAVIAETGARGRLSDLVLAMVVLADLVLLVLFSVAMQFARVGPRRRVGRERQRAGAARLGNRRRGRVRQPGRRALRAVPALRRPRSHARPHRGVRAAEPGRRDAGVRAAARGDGRRAGDREPRRRAGRRAEGRASSAARCRCSWSSSSRSARRCGSTRSRRSAWSSRSRWPLPAWR